MSITIETQAMGYQPIAYIGDMSSIDVSKIKLFQLRAFVAVAEHKGFGDAAATLEISQSAVSHAIASLESELGVVLFSRGRHGSTLTYVGEQILAPAQQILSLLETVVEQAIASRRAETGQVRIATLRSLATHWLPPIMASFSQQQPQINVTVRKCFDHVEVRALLKSRDVDIGLTEIANPHGLSIVDIGLDPYILILPADWLPPNEPVTWPYLQQHPIIMPAPNDHGYDALRDYVARLDNPLTVAYEINEDATIVSMVAQKLGIAILPYVAAIPIPRTVQVRPLPQELTRQLAAVILDDVLHSPAVFLFLDIVRQQGQRIFTSISTSDFNK